MFGIVLLVIYVTQCLVLLLLTDKIIGSLDIPLSVTEKEEIFDDFELIDSRFKKEQVKGKVGMSIRIIENV